MTIPRPLLGEQEGRVALRVASFFLCNTCLSVKDSSTTLTTFTCVCVRMYVCMYVCMYVYLYPPNTAAAYTYTLPSNFMWPHPFHLGRKRGSGVLTKGSLFLHCQHMQSIVVGVRCKISGRTHDNCTYLIEHVSARILSSCGDKSENQSRN